MAKLKSFTYAAMLFACGSLAAGEVLFDDTFDSAEAAAKNWGKAGGAAFAPGECFDGGGLRIVNSDPKSANLLPAAIDAAKVRGKTLRVTSMVKGENVTKPEKSWLGVKAMIYYRTASGRQEWVEHQPKRAGTFGWEEIVTRAAIPADAQEVSIRIGLQESSGTVWFDDIKAEVVD